MEPGFLELLFTSGTLEHGIFSFTGSIVIVSAIFVVLSKNNKRIHAEFEEAKDERASNKSSINKLRIDHEKLSTEFHTRKNL